MRRVGEERPSLADEEFEDIPMDLGVQNFGKDFKLKKIDKNLQSERVGTCIRGLNF